MKTFLKHIKQADLFEKPVKLLIKKQEGHKTILGACLSLFIMSLLMILLINNLSSLIGRTNPSSLEADIYHTAPPMYKLVPQNFTLQFGIENANYATYIDESIFIAKATYKRMLTKTINGKQEQVNADVPLPIVRCNTTGVVQQTELVSYFSHFDPTTNYCIDWTSISEIELEGSFDSPNFQFIHISINICSNETKRPNGPACQDRAAIMRAIEHNYISIQMSNQLLNLKDLNKPFQSEGYDMYTTISGNIQKEISIMVQPMTTITDEGLFTSTAIRQSTIAFHNMQEILDINQGSDLMAEINVKLTKFESTHYRSYPKLQDIFGQLGGLWSVLYTVASFLQMPISIISYKLVILNSLFNFEQSDTKFSQNNLLENLENRKTYSNTIKSSRINVQQKLNSIIEKHNQFEHLKETQHHEKSKLADAISISIKSFFQIVSKKLRLSWLEYLTQLKYTYKYILYSQFKYKAEQYNFSVNKMEKSFDILFIIKKLQEVDKLKSILLNKNQLMLFDYLPKPLIREDLSNPLLEKEQLQYFSILRNDKTNYQNAVEAQQAFQELQAQINDPINQKLIKCLDEDILQLLKLQLVDSSGSRQKVSPTRFQANDYISEGPEIDAEYSQSQFEEHLGKLRPPMLSSGGVSSRLIDENQ